MVQHISNAFIVMNVIILIVVFVMIDTSFADKYHKIVAFMYWSTLVIGTILLIYREYEAWFVFPFASVILLVVFALVRA